MNKTEYDAVVKVIDWFEKQAIKHDKDAAACDRFQSLKQAYIFDAKNFRAMANDLRKVAQSKEGVL